MPKKVMKPTDNAIDENYCDNDKWFVSIALCPKKIGMVFDNKLDATNFYDAASSKYQGAEIVIGRKRKYGQKGLTSQMRLD